MASSLTETYEKAKAQAKIKGLAYENRMLLELVHLLLDQKEGEDAFQFAKGDVYDDYDDDNVDYDCNDEEEYDPNAEHLEDSFLLDHFEKATSDNYWYVGTLGGT